MKNGGSGFLPYIGGNPITQRAVMQLELDFSMLSYGKAHIPLEVFEDYGAEYVFECGTRRVICIEFLDYMKRNHIEHLNLVAFIHIVHPRWPRSGIAPAVQDWAPNLGWALGLSPDLCDCIHRLWVAANKGISDDGRETISFEEFARLAQVESNFALDYDDVRQMFYATDEDGNGILTKDEFARFISGNVDVADVEPPQQITANAENPLESNASAANFGVPNFGGDD